MSKLIGKPTINPILFYSGKISGYLAVISMPLQFLVNFRIIDTNYIIIAASLLFLIMGVGLTFVSILNLGDAISLGIPKEYTEFKSGGLYKFSRNPMYVGFHCLSISAVLFTLNIFIAILVIYSLFVYHIIIKGEEEYLQNKFGDKYIDYTNQTRRYF